MSRLGAGGRGRSHPHDPQWHPVDDPVTAPLPGEPLSTGPAASPPPDAVGPPAGHRPRHRAGWRRPGPVAIAGIAAAVLAIFGLCAVVVPPLFDEPTGVGTPVIVAPMVGETVDPSADASPSPDESPSPSAGPSTSGPTAMENAVVIMVNAERAKRRCPAVRTDERLRTAARGHSRDMAAKGFLSHTGSDGSSFDERIRRTGYPTPLSENIAVGYRTAADVMAGWMRSKGHRANILDCTAKAVGVGLAYRADGTPYWTQDFGRS